MKKNAYAKIRSGKDPNPKNPPYMSFAIERLTDFGVTPEGLNRPYDQGLIDGLFKADDIKFNKGVDESFERGLLETERKMIEQDIRELESGGDDETLRGIVPDTGGRSLNPYSIPPGYFKRKK